MPVKSTSALVSNKLYTLGESVVMPYHNDVGIVREFATLFYNIRHIEGRWWLEMLEGFQWNGANRYPDYDFILLPSAKHDVNCWLIEHGIIPQESNDLIDLELKLDVQQSKTKIPFTKGGFIPRKMRGWIIGRATNLHNAKKKEGVIEHQFMYRRIEL